MRIYFIRHAIALERKEWDQDDMLRPLTKEGVKRFKSFFKKISKNIKKPDMIISSEAERSKATAKIVSKIFSVDYVIDSRINPGADIMQYKLLIEELEEKEVGTVAIIGHEPDLSNFISFYLSEGSISIKLKKGSFVHVKDKVLYNLVQPDILEK
ncbi:MAG: histidine phosphatase family protein [Calditerrivibrio sp.]|nr:histidine phosphatase family protein [Calditerrivibrio sp.]